MIQFSAPLIPGWHDDPGDGAGAGELPVPEHDATSDVITAATIAVTVVLLSRVICPV
jgi:hypothetical protein